MYQFIPLQDDYLSETSLKANVTIDDGIDQNKMWTLNKEIKLEYLYNFGSESELSSWANSSVG